MTPKTTEVGDWICWITFDRVKMYGRIDYILPHRQHPAMTRYVLDTGCCDEDQILEVRPHSGEAMAKE